MFRWFLWRVLSVLVFAGVARDQGTAASKDLVVDLAAGIIATAVLSGAWWLLHRYIEACKRAFRQGYREATERDRREASKLVGQLVGAYRGARRQEYRETMAREGREAVRRAGRFVGACKRAWRQGYGDTREPDR